MDYDKLKKEELIEILQKKDQELYIFREGTKEKDKIIASRDTTIKSLEQAIKHVEENIETVIKQKVDEVHLSYSKVITEAKMVYNENQRVNRGLVTFSGAMEKLIELKNKQNEVIDTFVESIQNEYLIKEEEVNNG